MGEWVNSILAKILAWVTDRELADAVVGDLEEQRQQRARESRARAAVWFMVAGVGVVMYVAVKRLRGVVPHTPFEWRSLASEARQAARVSSGSGSPVASIAAPPIRCSLKRKSWP